MTGKPEVHAWFMGEEIAGDDPLAAVKHRAAAIDAAWEETAAAEKKGHVGARADAIAPAAALAADEAFTADEVTDMWRASGLTGDDLDAAANVAFELWKIEQQRK